MIPALIVFGLLCGRWWRSALILAALGWPVLLVASGVEEVGPGLLAAAGLAVLNTGVGVLIHQGVLLLVRRRRTF
ncbi:hypothetical protein AB0875_10870 [Micromonospora gifhornensis]|uniref:hypothetical protein n=1 Tax=Micromonospora gifhornensis TaxID=84594 RepID=UPI003453BFE3